MELFVVNRYEGEKSKTEDPKENESSILERLLAKIQEKKREAENAKSVGTQGGVRKKKKLKRSNEPSGVNDSKPTSAEYEGLTGVKKTNHKKSKKKGLGVQDNLDGKFTVIGSDDLGMKKNKVKAVLPHWLSNPSIVSVDLKNLHISIDDLPELDKHLVDKLRKNGITHFFPVQHQVIPWLLEAQSKPPQFWPRDICVSAPTGSGKTFAFVLPIIQALQHRLVPQVRALVVLPVQELATQVYKVFQTYANGTTLRVALITGKESFQQEQSGLVFYSKADGEYQSLVDIVVTTPGRLVDHIQATPGFSLHHLRFLVIDEADRVMESMQNDWLYHLDRHIRLDDMSGSGAAPLTVSSLSVRRPPPQKLLFSATLSQDPEKLQQLGLFQPRLFTSVVTGATVPAEGGPSSGFVGKFTTPAELTEKWVTSEPAEKPLQLYHLIVSGNWTRVLVFTSTVEGVHRLSVLLQHLLEGKRTVSEVSSAVQRKKRKQIFEQFAAGEIDILVSSDALARGIDIPNVDYVVSYDAPKFIKNYIHRVGRTGRAGRLGTAITLVEPRQKNKFQHMLDQAGKREMVQELLIETSDLEPLEDLYKEALSSLRQQLEKEEGEKKAVTKKTKKMTQKYKKRKLNGVRKASSRTAEANRLAQKVKKLHQNKKLSV